MKNSTTLLALASFIILTLFGSSTDAIAISPTSSESARRVSKRKTLRPFATKQELTKYLKEIAERPRPQPKALPPASLSATQTVTSSDSAGLARARSSSAESESITNVQHAGVDEGGIVKLHGDYLVILRRGRLFTVAINDRSLRPVSVVNSFGPGVEPEDTWYDEMLIAGDTIAVIGYSYAHNGTEIGLFRIDSGGGLRYRATYHLRSDDYYSSRNYASRLIGNKLIFYTPLELYPGGEDPFEEFPALRKWHVGATEEEFRSIIRPTRVYRPEQTISGTNGIALHTVTTCDIARGGMKCEATALLGPRGRVFYVSPESVYVWVSDWMGKDETTSRSMLYRMPLTGTAPSALLVSGSPVDQFSFLEDEEGHLNVLVRSEANGDSMWEAEFAAGELALMRVTLSSFSDGTYAVPQSSYRKLAKPKGDTFQNRFVSDYLLYGTGSGWGPPENSDGSSLFAVRFATGDSKELPLVHDVDRIEAMGTDAVVIGTDGEDLHFTGVRLGFRPEIAQRYTRKEASQGELRSHGFFYREDGKDSGTLGLPISLPGRPGYEHLFEDSAGILFLRNDAMRFKEVGELVAQSEGAVDDNCQASCVDWYGNARPLFVRGRIFALMGYEIVEGTLSNGRLRETRRVSYAPRRHQIAGR